MPTVKANNLAIHFEERGTGEPLILIPYLAADHACYAFQVAEYAKYFTCISLDLRGTGESDKPQTSYTTEDLADDVAALMRVRRIQKAHVAGLSLGAAVGIWLAGKYPEMVSSLSLHSGWPKTDPFVRALVESWQIAAKALNSVPEMVVRELFLWCFTPELFAAKPNYIQSLAAFVRSRPAQSIENFMLQSNAVIAHDAEAQLGRVTAPTLITFGSRDLATSARFAGPLKSGIRNSESLVFEGCSHAALYESVEEFNGKTLAFLKHHSRADAASAR